MKTIENQYRAKSIYEWQNQYYHFRNDFVEVIGMGIKLFEGHLEQDIGRVNSASNAFAEKATQFMLFENRLKKLPSNSSKYFEKELYPKEENKIIKAFSSFRTFLNQVTGIFKSGDFHLPLINLKSALDDLEESHSAFEIILTNTYRYFDFSDIENREKTLLARLNKTVRFYHYRITKEISERVIVARKEVESWWQNHLQKELNELKEIIIAIENNTEFKLYAPTKIIEDGNLKYGVIGIEGCDLNLNEGDEFLQLSIASMRLLATDITFFTFVFIEDNKTQFGIRVSRDYFQKFVDLSEGREPEDNDFGNPLPVIPDIKLLEPLPGIHLNSVEAQSKDEGFYKMMFEVWRLSEYRSRLDNTNEVEYHWLNELEDLSKRNIVSSLNELDSNDPLNSRTKTLVENFLNEGKTLSKDEIVGVMTERAIETSKLSHS